MGRNSETIIETEDGFWSVMFFIKYNFFPYMSDFLIIKYYWRIKSIWKEFRNVL